MKPIKCKAMIYKFSENGSSRIEVTFKQMVTTVHIGGKINLDDPVHYRKFQHHLTIKKQETLLIVKR